MNNMDQNKLVETLRMYFNIRRSYYQDRRCQIFALRDNFFPDNTEERNGYDIALNTFAQENPNFRENIPCTPEIAAEVLLRLTPAHLEYVYINLRKNVLSIHLKKLFEVSVVPYSLSTFKDLFLVHYNNNNNNNNDYIINRINTYIDTFIPPLLRRDDIRRGYTTGNPEFFADLYTYLYTDPIIRNSINFDRFFYDVSEQVRDELIRFNQLPEEQMVLLTNRNELLLNLLAEIRNDMNDNRVTQRIEERMEEIQVICLQLEALVEPVVAPVEPVVAPIEPVVAPIEPVVAPVEPVVAPVEPVSPRTARREQRANAALARQQQVPEPAPAPVDVNINGLGIDVVGGDGDNPRTRISEFLTEEENRANSIVINVIDERYNGIQISTIYLYNKDIFMNQLNSSIVFPCTEANGVLNSVIHDRPLYSFANLIDRRINIHREELDNILNNGGNIFINLIKLPDTYPAIASDEIVRGIAETWVGGLHCNPGAEPEQVWTVRIATHGAIPEGGRKVRTRKVRNGKVRTRKVRNGKVRTRKVRNGKLRKSKK